MSDDVRDLLRTIAKVGSRHPSPPDLTRIEPFASFLDPRGALDSSALDRREGCCTRRELVLRFLVLSAVLDQGPDIEGVRSLVRQVTNELYRREVRFLHQPAAFFQEIGIAIDRILADHASVKKVRAEIWARENHSSPSRYNLFMDGTRQVLNYAIFRWGVPLALPLLLTRDESDDDRQADVLCRCLGSYPSAEKMSRGLKSDERYGLGKAIGDKACHLFAKWAVGSLPLLSSDEPNWGELSFEPPFDSNAGRVLWRTGFFLHWADEQAYRDKDVIRPRAGKEGLNHIRVTNIRGIKATVSLPSRVREAYDDLCCRHLCTHKRGPQSVDIQRICGAYLLADGGARGIAELDDGLIRVGTRYCLNHGEPKCATCPLRRVCAAAQGESRLIDEYRT